MELDITIDSREKKLAPFFANQLTMRGFACEIDKLDASDFVIYGVTPEDSDIIERKSASDFLGSIEGNRDKASGTWKEGRLWDQLHRMSEARSNHKWLLIEGNPYSKRLTAYRKKGFDRNRIWGAFAKVQDYGVSVFRSGNIPETVNWLEFMINRKQRPKKAYSLRVSAPRQMTVEEKKKYILQGFPGIGPKTSDRLIDKAPNLLAIFEDPEEFNDIISKRIVKEIHDIIYS